MRYLPKLRTLGYDRILEVLGGWNAPLLCLEDLHSPYGKQSKGALLSAIRLSPSVARVSLSSLRNIDDEDLKALLQLDRLEYLSLSDVSVSFSGGILPLLKKFGSHSRRTLALNAFNNVDVRAIAECFPKLVELEFTDVRSFLPRHSLESAVNPLLSLKVLT